MAKFDNLEAVFNKLDEEEAVEVYGGKDLYMFGMKVGSPQCNAWVRIVNYSFSSFESNGYGGYGPGKTWSNWNK